MRIGNRNITMVSMEPLMAGVSVTSSGAFLTLTSLAPSVEAMVDILSKENINVDDDTRELLESISRQYRVSRVNIAMPTAPNEMEELNRLHRVDTDSIHAVIVPVRPAERQSLHGPRHF